MGITGLQVVNVVQASAQDRCGMSARRIQVRPRWVLSLVLSISAGCGAALCGLPRAAQAREKVDVVVIDAGHGGDDFGAIGVEGTLEKNVALRFSLQLGRMLEAQGIRVVHTRRDDKFVSLADRTRIANIARADLYVSIHANSSPDPAVEGPETYFMSLEASEGDSADVAMTENQVFEREAAVDDSGDVVGSILGDLIRLDHLQVSAAVAGEIQRELAALPGPSRGVRQGKFIVLSGVNMPSVLIELGFLTSRKDERNLNSASYRNELAAAIVRAVKGLEIVDRRRQQEAEARLQEDAE